MMDERTDPSDAEFWTRARRHLLKYGGQFLNFVPVRAEGVFLYDLRRNSVDVRSTVIGRRAPVDLAIFAPAIGGSEAPRPSGARQVRLNGGWFDTRIFDRASLGRGATVAGPGQSRHSATRSAAAGRTGRWHGVISGG